MAAMLGARVFVLHDAYPGNCDVAGQQSCAGIAVPMDGVKTLYVGFPIWGERPSPAAPRTLQRLSLTGVRVVPFYTYVHFADPESLRQLADLMNAAGAHVEPAIAIRIGMFASVEDMTQMARRALLERPDLWRSGAPSPLVRCVAGSEATSSQTCSVPAGPVWLGDLEGRTDSRPPRRVQVPAFEIQQREVTVHEYGACVAAGRCQAIERSDLLEKLSPHDDVPQSYVSFEQAQAYCAYAGMRVPTEAEWMRAGRGEEAAPFPWGTALPSRTGPPRGNLGERLGTGIAHYTLVADDADWPSDGYPGLAPGCSFPAGNSVYGVCDLEGNLAEWTTGAGVTAPHPVLKGATWIDADRTALDLGARGELGAPIEGLGFYLTGVRCVR
jgi:formylglycine-generating enzyme required for sulfatase activity